nr:MAG TPA: nucelotide kinase [Caudoviricetes sp.]
MIYRFMYQNPPKATRHASMAVAVTPKDLSITARAAYRAKYGTDMVADGYSFFAHSAESGDVYAGDPGTDADGGVKGPKPSILDLIAPAYSKKVDYDPKSDTVTFHGGSDEESRAKEIISEVFEDIDRPDRYLQGEIDLIDAAYLLFPWDQFKGFMKITIMRYTLRYEHKGWLKDLDKITVYTRRLKELEVKNKEREDRNNEK